MNAGRIAWSIVGMLSLSAAARAGPVTWEFAGEVTRIIDPDNLLNGQVVIGSPLQGSFTFESTTPDSNPDPTGGLRYNALIDLQGTVGSLSLTWPTTPTPTGRNYIDVNLGDGGLPDLYGASIPTSFLGYDFFNLSILLQGPPGSIFSEIDALPLIPPDLSVVETGFFLLDPTETIYLVVDGELSFLVPEPSTLIFLVLGAGALARRKRGVFRAARANHAFVSFVVLTLTALRTFGSDCNTNGLDDAQELAQPCKIDVVVIFDTSASMNPISTIAKSCNAINAAKTTLVAEGKQVNVEFLVITGGPISAPCPCCVDGEGVVQRVPEIYGTGAGEPGQPNWYPDVLGSCQGSNENQEDWGPATGIVALKKSEPGATYPWTPGAVRIIMPIFDEGPRCGDAGGGGFATNAIDNAAKYVCKIIIAPIFQTDGNPLARALAETLVDRGAPGGKVFESADSETALTEKLLELFRWACPKDCNTNLVPDACDLVAEPGCH